MSTLSSKIRICKNIKLDKSYNNVLDYSSPVMLALCESNDHLVASANDYSFIRQRGTISVNFTYSQCLQSNYMCFQNKDYDNKWFFAFIDDIHFITEGTTEISYTIDAWTTFWDNWTRDTCFVVREHVSDDTIGLHTVPENLDIGEVIQESETYDVSYGTDFGYYVIVASNWTINDNSTGQELLPSDKGSQYSGVSVYDNNVFGTKLFLFDINSTSDFLNLVFFLMRTNSDGHIEDVQNIFVLPNAFIQASKLNQHSASFAGDSFSWYTLSYDMSPQTFNTTVAKRHSFTGFTPKNNKCFVYPYNYLLVSNNNGSNNIYKYENFSTNNCVFQNQMSIAIGGSGRIVPKNYKGMSDNEDEALPLGKYPTCAWSSDAFTNWLTQNGVNLAVNLGITAGSIASAIATGGASIPLTASATLTASSTILNTIGQFRQADLLPNISGGQATGDILWSNSKNMFFFREMRVKTEYLRIIDDYFTRFGYKVNRLKLPDFYSRDHWNYIEIGQQEEIGHGNVPNNYMEIINNIARKGTTIWHDHDEIGDYSLNNSP